MHRLSLAFLDVPRCHLHVCWLTMQGIHTQSIPSLRTCTPIVLARVHRRHGTAAHSRDTGEQSFACRHDTLHHPMRPWCLLRCSTTRAHTIPAALPTSCLQYSYIAPPLRYTTIRHRYLTNLRPRPLSGKTRPSSSTSSSLSVRILDPVPLCVAALTRAYAQDSCTCLLRALSFEQ